jgi:hypothetical protein
MSEDCESLIADAHQFPRRPENRAGLAHVSYRIGAFPEMLEEMLRGIDRATPLRAWTHRGADDPGIALLHGAAILGDILTFYQDHYANEAFLATARWRESVADLVRLTGYRLAPGLGGRGTLALIATGSTPVTVPRDYAVKADIADAPAPADLLTNEDVVALPNLSTFGLYAPRQFGAAMPAGSDTIELTHVGGDARLSARHAAGLTKGDRLLFLPGEPGFASNPVFFSFPQKAHQVLTIKEVKTVLDRTIITFDTPLQESYAVGSRVHKIGRTFRHLGFGASPVFTVSSKGAGGKIDGASEITTDFRRHIYRDHECTQSSFTVPLFGEQWPLDIEANDLTPGRHLAIELDVTYQESTKPAETRRLIVKRRIDRIRGTTMVFAGNSAATSFVTLDQCLVNVTADYETDIRSVRLHEIIGPPLTVAPPSTSATGNIPSGSEPPLLYFGTQAEVQALAGRRLMLWNKEDGRVEIVSCINDADQFTAPTSEADERRMWPISLAPTPKLFRWNDFPEENGAVGVFGNLVEVRQGRAMPLEVLGNGDGGQVFQTFKIPKPVTHHLDSTIYPPFRPELEVYVASRLWKRVESLYGQETSAQVYVLREDAEGNHLIQFGDGKTGARLPSGIGNVAVSWRTGSGTNGDLKPDVKPTGAGRLPGLSTLALPGGLFGAAEREDPMLAREAAPGKVQGLDRLISLKDFETELLTIPGVERVRADWAIRDGVPLVVLTVLVERGREEDYTTIAESIRQTQRLKGPDRHAVLVEQAFRRPVYLDLRYGLDPRFLESEVSASILAKLGLLEDEAAPADSLFGVRARRLGQREFASRIEAAVQAIEGVVFVEVTGFDLLPRAAIEQGIRALPSSPRAARMQVVPLQGELLCLPGAYLALVAAPPDVTGGTP